MKHILFFLFTLLAAIPSSAQTQASDSLQNRFLETKVQEISNRLQFTDDQKAQFTPVYRRYTEAMIAACDGYQKPVHPSTSQEAAANIRKHLEVQQRLHGIRLRFVDEFAAVLNPQQMSRLFSLENMVQRKVKAAMSPARPHSSHPARKASFNNRPAWQSQPPAAKLPGRLLGKHSHQRQRIFNGVKLPKEPHVHKHDAGATESVHSH